jgi:hypothetical protein
MESGRAELLKELHDFRADLDDILLHLLGGL